MEQSNRKKRSNYHPSARVEDGKPLNGMRLYIEERDIYGNFANPHDDDDLSSIGNSISRYVDSGVSFLEDADGRKERMDVLGLSEKDFIGVPVSRDSSSSTAELDSSLIQEAPLGSQPDALYNNAGESKGWFISHRLCLPRWMQLAPTWLQVIVLGSLLILIVSIVVAGIALSQMNHDSSQSNPILGGPEARPTPSPITMGQTNAFSPTVNVKDQSNESRPTANVQDQIALGEMNNDSSPSKLILVGSGATPTPSPISMEQTNVFSPTVNVQNQIDVPQPTSSPTIPLESGPNNIFSPTNKVPESGAPVLANDLPLVEPPTSAPTAHPTKLPSAKPVDVSSAPSSPPTPQIRSTQLPSSQSAVASSALSTPSSPPTPQIRSTQLPSTVQSAVASSALSSPPTFPFSSGGKRYSFFQPSE
jgi:hypothetical protein